MSWPRQRMKEDVRSEKFETHPLPKKEIIFPKDLRRRQIESSRLDISKTDTIILTSFFIRKRKEKNKKLFSREKI